MQKYLKMDTFSLGDKRWVKTNVAPERPVSIEINTSIVKDSKILIRYFRLLTHWLLPTSIFLKRAKDVCESIISEEINNDLDQQISDVDTIYDENFSTADMAFISQDTSYNDQTRFFINFRRMKKMHGGVESQWNYMRSDTSSKLAYFYPGVVLPQESFEILCRKYGIILRSLARHILHLKYFDSALFEHFYRLIKNTIISHDVNENIKNQILSALKSSMHEYVASAERLENNTIICEHLCNQNSSLGPELTPQIIAALLDSRDLICIITALLVYEVDNTDNLYVLYQ